MKRIDSGAKRLQSLYHLCGSKVVSIDGIERTGGRTAFKRQGDQVPEIFLAGPEKSHLARKPGNIFKARNLQKSGEISSIYGYFYDFSWNLA